MPRHLWVLLEGPDDQRFFDKLLRPEFLKKYDKITPYLYAQRSKKEIERTIKSIKDLGSEYIIFSDFDCSSCITESKKNLQIRIQAADVAKVAVVKTEIESWYLAGLDQSGTRKLGVPFYTNTEDTSKKIFEQNRSSSRFDTRVDFMLEILKIFDIDTAKKQNNSFRYVWQKFIF